MVQKYELMIVASTGSNADLLGRVEKALKSANASGVKLDKMGKKQLAYTIKKQQEAEFTVINFEAEGSAISELVDMLRLEQEALLRYLLIKPKTYKIKKKKGTLPKEVKEEQKAAPKVTVVTKKVEKPAKVVAKKEVKKTSKAKKK